MFLMMKSCVPLPGESPTRLSKSGGAHARAHSRSLDVCIVMICKRTFDEECKNLVPHAHAFVLSLHILQTHAAGAKSP